jgi:hydroxyacylglutathione hydrolase
MRTVKDVNVLILGVPAFDSNYLWVIHNGFNAWAVDPGDANAVQAFLSKNRLQLSGILITHHHADHVGGILALKRQYPDAQVIGPMNEKIKGLETDACDGNTYALTGLGQLAVRCLAVPGHTKGHVAYFIDDIEGVPRLFCGDTLFAAGCGRLFEGTPAQLHDSLQILLALPTHTLAYCAHEYTLANLNFALAIEPNNQDLVERLASVRSLREANLPTVPFVLGLEPLSNPFLRTHQPSVMAKASELAALELTESVDVFTVLREWKNQF